MFSKLVQDCYNTENILSKMTCDAYKINLVYKDEKCQ